MLKIIDYTDDNRNILIAEQKALGFLLIEDQRHFDGNHLIFNNEPYIEPEPEPLTFVRLNPSEQVKDRLTHIEDWLEGLE